ncbi:MAG: hypothetical protein NC833_03310 [Candidatus Omnitrophica bacterium]|nr:hypothetical protein [Candidatus Omnitrophota bacterium]
MYDFLPVVQIFGEQDLPKSRYLPGIGEIIEVEGSLLVKAPINLNNKILLCEGDIVAEADISASAIFSQRSIVSSAKIEANNVEANLHIYASAIFAERVSSRSDIIAEMLSAKEISAESISASKISAETISAGMLSIKEDLQASLIEAQIISIKEMRISAKR